jgi:hypothetical protein
VRREIKNLADLAPALKRLHTFPEAMRKEVHRTMQASVSLLESEVTERTPVGATEELRNSIYGEVRDSVYGTEVTGIVGAPVVYALPVEMGTKPHWPPKGALTSWVRRKLQIVGDDHVASVEFRIRAKIAARGTKGAHMFRKGWLASRDRIGRLWQKLANEAIRRHFS